MLVLSKFTHAASDPVTFVCVCTSKIISITFHLAAIWEMEAIYIVCRIITAIQGPSCMHTETIITVKP